MSNGDIKQRTKAYGRTDADVDVFGTNKYRDISSGYDLNTGGLGALQTSANTALGGLIGSGITTSAPAATPNIPKIQAPAAAPGGGGGFGQQLMGAAGKDPGAIGQVAMGLGQVASGIIGGGQRRREQRAAREELSRRQSEYEQFEFQNQFADLTNPYEDLTVNKQEAEFLAQQQQQALASTMSGMSAAAGGSGIGALAQAMAQQRSQNLQASAASIGQQESRNQMLRAQGQEAMEVRRASGAAAVEAKEFARTEDLYNTAAARKAAADEARRQATQNIIGGVANTVAGAGRLAAAAATGGASEAAMSLT